MKRKICIGLLLFFLLNFFVYSEEINVEELKEMLKNNLISQEDYNILIGDKSLEDGIGYYELKINGDSINKNYIIMIKNRKLYFPLKAFFESINFTNYNLYKNREVKIYLGESLREIEITPKEFKVEELVKPLTTEDIIYENEEIYLVENIFKEIFLKNIRIDSNNYIVGMYLNFSIPDEIKIKIERTKEKLEEEKDRNTLLYISKPQLFELGYLRTKLAQTYEKNIDNHTSEKDWEGEFEYQGAFLYGELNFGYDLRNKKFNDAILRYDEIYDTHTFELGNYQVGDGKNREWGGSFKKDKGYILTSDKTYIIKENVPIGSRVELLYLGFPIDVQDAENGVVVFSNQEIKGDREYYLKIYDLDGRILMKRVDTASNYNQQNKGQFEYDISFREDDESKKTRFNSKIYYGITEKLTIGVGQNREIENINNKYEYVDDGNLELVWSDFLFSYPYTLGYEKSKTFTKLSETNSKKNYKDKNTDIFKGQLDIKDLRFKFENIYRGEYYDEKRSENYIIEYRPFRSFEIGYDIEKDYYYDNKREKRDKVRASYSKSIKSLLVTAEYEKANQEKPEYSINLYYNGLRTQSIRLENKWTNGGKDYEIGLTIFSSSNRILDYTFEARYSEKTKDYLTFRASLKYENLFNYEGETDKKGNQKHKIGIDRITDLKNPREKIESLSSSRVKVITFIDINDNNICDDDEPRIDNVKVKIGEKEVLTNKKGEGILYGIPNHIVYDLNPVIRKPSFVIGNNKIKVKGKTSSTLTAYIPVKPLLTLTGLVHIDPILQKSSEQKIAMYSNMLVKVKDLSGKIIDMAIPDEMGIFEISGLLPKKYSLEISYTGVDMSIDKLEEYIKLGYLNTYDSKENDYIVSVSKNSIRLNKNGEEK